MPSPPIFVLADDLSGAAETAAVLGLHRTRRRPSVIHLFRDGILRDAAGLGVVVVDLDSRHASPQLAGDRVRAALRGRAAGSTVFKKTDSLLRGNIADEIGALAEIAPVLFVPALPQLARTVVGGILTVEGVPLQDTPLWHAERSAPPATVAEALGPLPSAPLRLDDVRGPRDRLVLLLQDLAARRVTVIADAETPDDIARLVDAAADVAGLVYAGSSALASALTRHDADPTEAPPAEDGPPARSVRPSRLLIVVGTASHAAREQVVRLAARGVPVIELSPGRLVGGDRGAADAAALIAADASPVLAVALSPHEPVAAESADRLVDALARAVGDAARGSDLVLTGGETARRVLDLLGVDELRPVAEIEAGTVHSLTPDGRSVVTRPGSFGGPDSLSAIVEDLRPESLRSDPGTIVAPAEGM